MSLTDEQIDACKHGVRFPHECKECEHELCAVMRFAREAGFDWDQGDASVGCRDQFIGGLKEMERLVALVTAAVYQSAADKTWRRCPKCGLAHLPDTDQMTAPCELRCGTCAHWSEWEGQVGGPYCHHLRRSTREKWFCADWKARQA